jgi:hypothetical protein
MQRYQQAYHDAINAAIHTSPYAPAERIRHCRRYIAAKLRALRNAGHKEQAKEALRVIHFIGVPLV